MKVLVIGSGGREHALVWKLSQSRRVSKIYCAPGNAGIAELADCVNIGVTDLKDLVEFAVSKKIDLTVVGPELPLTMGISDLFGQERLKIFGVNQKAAILEESKAFAKDLMKKYHIPTGYYQVFTNRKNAELYVNEIGTPVVIKADGLAAGKGVYVCRNMKEAKEALIQLMVEKIFGSAGEKVVIEEYLEGEEASFLAFTDGRNVLPMVSSQDHKTIFDDDRGPNTGGMGAYSPAPVVTTDYYHSITDEIMRPVIQGMAAEGRTYRGVLYAGLMFTSNGPKVLEFNVRFGDPETQAILPRMNSDIVPVLEACIDGRLDRENIEWNSSPAVCVVMASGGYPHAYEKGKVIRGLAKASKLKNTVVFHAGTARDGDNTVTSGGRVLGVTAVGKSIEEAINLAYKGTSLIKFEGAHYRRDIGRKALIRTNKNKKV